MALAIRRQAMEMHRLQERVRLHHGGRQVRGGLAELAVVTSAELRVVT